ncbi:MAG TPA: ATP-grasp domain-containing protein [Nocardioidaceae bacterium]|nr:ATP-grasp domain-containing protein [Nocardioidaceae bacterium]
MVTENVFVLGLDDHNREILAALPDADQYRFHPLLTIEELQYGDEIPLADLLEKAKQQLDDFEGKVDAVIGFWDFPVSTMVPLLSAHTGTYGATLESVVKCEHKYWSRLEQQKVIDEHPAFGLVDPDHDQEPPSGVDSPMWVKPVKSFSSALAFGVQDRQEFRAALTEIREGIGRIGEPFEVILDKLDLPAELAEIGGRACLAEETISGQQVTLEGYVHHDEVRIFGVVDTINLSEVQSQERFQYPSSVPDAVAERMADIAGRIVRQVGLDHTTFNIEFFWNPDTDAVNVLEVNPRHSQSHAELFQDVDGVANHRAMLQLALGRDPQLPRGEGPHAIAAKWFLRHFTDGVVRRTPTAEEVAAVERDLTGVTIDVIVADGDRLSELPDQDSYSYKIANIYLGGVDEADLKDKFERVAQALPFEFDESA